MLTLPKNSLKVTRHKAAEAELLKKLRDVLGANEREGIHASDLLDPRQSFWRMKDPRELDEREVGFFIIGRVLHEIVLAHQDGESDLPTQVHPELGIHYSIDSLDAAGNPVELKTSRAKFEMKKVSEIDNYIEQLLAYMAASGRTEGRIDVLHLSLLDNPQYSQRTSPAVRSYKVVVSEADLKQFKTELQATSNALKTALSNDDPSELPLCRTWKCGYGNCKWWTKCKPPGRHGKKNKKDWTA